MLRKYVKFVLWLCAISWVVVALLVHMRLTFYSSPSTAIDERANSCRAVAAIAATLHQQYRAAEVSDTSTLSTPSIVSPIQLKPRQRRRDIPLLPRIVVYRPFVSKDVNVLLLNMKAWSNSALLPCESSPLLNTANSVDLVFWSATPAAEVQSLKHLVERAPWRSCFGDVRFRSFGTREKLVETGYNNPSIVFQFLTVFRELRSKGYSYVFQMEPDVLPIRRGWVDRLLHICSAASAGINDFWMLASLTVKDDFDTATGQVQTEDFLPNGNGIWNVGNKHFAALVDAWIGDVFLGTKFNYTDPYNGFDRAIHESRLRDDVVVDAHGVQIWGNGSSRHYFHKFAFTDFVVNYGRYAPHPQTTTPLLRIKHLSRSFRLYSQTALKNAQHNAFLAHSKWPLDSLPEILSQIVHRRFGDGLAAAIVDYTLLQG